MLTKGLDNITGTAGNDTIIGSVDATAGSDLVSAPQTPFFPGSLGRDQMLGLEIPGQEGLEVFDSGRGR